MAMSRNEIFDQVKEVLVDALGLDEDEVTEDATLMGDLGAESIDFLDIVFRLEKAFGIKVPREELFPAESLMSNPEYVSGGKVTPKGWRSSRRRCRTTDFTKFENNPDVNKMTIVHRGGDREFCRKQAQRGGLMTGPYRIIRGRKGNCGATRGLPCLCMTMRWIWIDKFLEFESGKRAVALKNVTLAEEHLHDHFPGFPVMPECLMIEAMAQTAGILVGEARKFDEKVILAKIKNAVFHHFVVPGDTITLICRDRIDRAGGGQHDGTITRGDTLIAEISLMFSHIDKNLAGKEFPEENFVFTDMFNSLLTGICRSEEGIPGVKSGGPSSRHHGDGGDQPAWGYRRAAWEGLWRAVAGSRRFGRSIRSAFRADWRARCRNTSCGTSAQVLSQGDQADEPRYRAFDHRGQRGAADMRGS